MLSRIYLIRHGKTDGNRNHWYYGATDLPLNEGGLAEIRAYVEEGIYPEIPDDADFYTTGLIRTDQTLSAIYGDHKHTAIPALQEINFGKAECMTYDDLKEFDNFEKWAWDTTGDERIADAETSNEFHVRIHKGLEELLDKHHRKEQSNSGDGKDAVSVVVCHGGVIACIMEKLFPAVCGSMWDWLPEPGFGYAVDFDDGEPYMYSKINDIGRLGLGIYRLPRRNRTPRLHENYTDLLADFTSVEEDESKPRQIDHKAVRALIDTQMTRGHGFFELEFLAWPDEVEPDLKKQIKALRNGLIRRYDRNRYYLTALVDASMLGQAADMIDKLGVKYLDRLAVCGIERYYKDYPEDANIEPETLADKRIDGPEGETGRPVSAELETVWSEMKNLKDSGMIKKAGLAFSGSATLLDDLLKDRQEVDYVELPVNYKMGFEEGDLAQKYYTIARRRYKEILVRSPFAGGELAELDKGMFRKDEESDISHFHIGKKERKALESTEADGASERGKESSTSIEVLRKTMAGYALLKQDRAPQSAVDWALRYVLSFPFVVTCIASSGDPDHAAENMDAAERFRPLTEDERELLKKTAENRR